MVFKILTRPEAATLLEARAFTGTALDRTDGFIHLSGRDQLEETLDRHFASQVDLVIAAIDETKISGSLRWERSRGGADFPHLYADLTLEILEYLVPLRRHADGKVVLPA